MNCNMCKHNKSLQCVNPKNYQPLQRQHKRVKQLGKWKYPKPPNWCKGYQFEGFTIILVGTSFSCPPPSNHPNWELL